MDLVDGFGLKQLTSPLPNDHVLDIVFVHGLNGQRSRTWTTGDDLWPKWFAQDLPGAKVWTYGYDSRASFGSKDGIDVYSSQFLIAMEEIGVGKKDGATGVEDVAIVFVSHSLGGVLVKHSLVFASSSPGQSFSYIENNTIGLVFAGTPHRGSAWANRLFLLHFGVLSSEFVRILRWKSSTLVTLAERFNNIWGRKPILSFREKLRVLGIGKIVKESDAVTNCSAEEIIDIEADHRQLVRPTNRKAMFYTELLRFLRGLNTNIRASLSAPTSLSSAPRISKSLSLPEKPRSRGLQQCLWKDLHPTTPLPGCEEWIIVTEDWIDDNSPENYKNWLGGCYFCSFPPGQDQLATIRVEVDLTDSYPIIWMIEASEPYYPGRHVGRLELSATFPFEQPYIHWDTPIFSPFVRFESGVGTVSSPFDLGVWRPSYTIQHLLQTIAAILVLDPMCKTPSPITHGRLKVPFQFHQLANAVYASQYEGDMDSFRLVTHFFSRVYCRINSRRVENPLADPQQLAASVAALKVIERNHCGAGGLPSPVGREGTSVEDAFSYQLTNEEWIQEEFRWADAVSTACNFGFVAN